MHLIKHTKQNHIPSFEEKLHGKILINQNIYRIIMQALKKCDTICYKSITNWANQWMLEILQHVSRK